MKIFVICSKRFYDRIPEIRKVLEKNGHSLTMPNCYDTPGTEEKYRVMGRAEHSKWKAEMINHSVEVIQQNDAVLVLNLEKDGVKNYIGGATFLEIYDAFRLGKKIFLYNDIPEGMLADEIDGFNPVIIGGDLNRIV